MGFSIPVSNFHLIVEGGGGQSGQGLLVLPPRCEIVLVRTLIIHVKFYVLDIMQMTFQL